MAHNPPLDFVNYLDTNSTAVTGGTNLFLGQIRPHSTSVPVKSVFVRGYEGEPPLRVFGTATEVRKPKISVTVRSSDYQSGYSLAQTIYTKMQSASPSTTNVYMDVRALQSEPNFLEQDKNMHFFFSLNWEVSYTTT